MRTYSLSLSLCLSLSLSRSLSTYPSLPPHAALADAVVMATGSESVRELLGVWAASQGTAPGTMHLNHLPLSGRWWLYSLDFRPCVLGSRSVGGHIDSALPGPVRWASVCFPSRRFCCTHSTSAPDAVGHSMRTACPDLYLLLSLLWSPSLCFVFQFFLFLTFFLSFFLSFFLTFFLRF